MAQLEEVRKGELTYISTPMSNCPRDLLPRFISVSHLPVKLEEPGEDSEELELTLGLSLNGRFGVDPRAKKIKRTSSIPEFVENPEGDDDDTAHAMPIGCTPLMRACSLPTEAEKAEWRKRKELQTLRRMEARRKRWEKHRNSKVKEGNRRASEESGVEGNNGNEKGSGSLNEQLTSLRKTTSLTRACLGGLKLNGEKGSGLPPTPSSQRSNGSPGTWSSGISESECHCQTAQGTKSMDARNPVGGNSLQDGGKKSPIAKNTSELGSPENRANEIVRNMLKDMPCVSTKGEGPHGKRIGGFLYGYKKGEEVRIVCVCHGSFLTPAEFVKHAGGSDVAHPLRHIVVTPNLL